MNREVIFSSIYVFVRFFILAVNAVKTLNIPVTLFSEVKCTLYVARNACDKKKTSEWTARDRLYRMWPPVLRVYSSSCPLAQIQWRNLWNITTSRVRAADSRSFIYLLSRLSFARDRAPDLLEQGRRLSHGLRPDRRRRWLVFVRRRGGGWEKKKKYAGNVVSQGETLRKNENGLKSIGGPPCVEKRTCECDCYRVPLSRLLLTKSAGSYRTSLLPTATLITLGCKRRRYYEMLVDNFI